MGARVSVYTADPHMKNTMVQQWNLTVQQRVGNNLFDLGYVANKANRYLYVRERQRARRFQFVVCARNGSLHPSAILRDQLAAVGRLWELPLPAGEVRAAHRWRGVPEFVHRGHAISDAEQGQSAVGVGNPGNFHFLSNRHLDKSSTTFDIRQRFTSGILYQIPYRRNQEGFLGKVFGAWETNLLFTAQTGSGTQVSDGTGLATSYSRFDRPDLVGNPILPRGQRTESRYFNTDAFQVVTTPRFGTAPRMNIRQPGSWTPDLSLAKNFRMTERFHLVVRADAYNAFNHANWVTVDSTIRDTSVAEYRPAGDTEEPYGRVNSFGNPRGCKFRSRSCSDMERPSQAVLTVSTS